MAARSKVFRPSATLAVVHASPRFVSRRRAHRARSLDARRRGREISSLQGLENSKNVEIIAPHPRQDSPPLRNPRHRRRLDKIARVLLDRSSFGICSNLGLGARWERRKIFLPAKL